MAFKNWVFFLIVYLILGGIYFTNFGSVFQLEIDDHFKYLILKTIKKVEKKS